MMNISETNAERVTAFTHATGGNRFHPDRSNTRMRAFMRNTAPSNDAEPDVLETREWLESLVYVLQSGGPARVSRLLRDLGDYARLKGVKQPFTANTPYVNTIPHHEQPPYPGSREIERRIKS